MSYIITLYGNYLLPTAIYEVLFPIAMIPATFAELSLGVWLLFKGGKIPKIKNKDETPA